VPEPKGYGKLRSRRYTLQEQQQALLGSDGIFIPDGTNLLIIAGPRLKDLKKIKRISEKVGEEALIVLLNARIGSYSLLADTNKAKSAASSTEEILEVESWYRQNFVNVFNYAPPITANKIISEQELLLYHEYNQPWYLAKKESSKNMLGLLGDSVKFTTLLKKDSIPVDDEIVTALKPPN
jgi:hypothetical protein